MTKPSTSVRIAAVLGSLIACDAPIEPPIPICTDCEIELLHLATLSDSVEPGVLPDQVVYVSGDAAHGYFVVSRDRTKVLSFRDSGSHVSMVGRAGDGPGEFRNVRRVFLGPGDSVFVSDWGTGRLTVFSAELKFGRTKFLPYFPAFVLADGQFIVSSQIQTPELIGYPIHLVDGNGGVVRSFGAEVPEYHPDLRLLATRVAAPAADGDVWAVAPGRYLLERWDPVTGELRHSTPVTSGWFQEIAKWPDDERVRPPSVIESLWEDGGGLVWFLIRTADSEWEPPPRANVERVIDRAEYDRTYDWILEVVDPQTGTVLASRRYPVALWGRPPSSLLVSKRSDDDSDALQRFNVWLPTLSPRGAP